MRDRSEAHARLKGVFNIAVTPFGADGSIDVAALRRHVERIVGLGFDGLLIGGTYGEFPAMTVAERAELFRFVMGVVGDRVPVMLCSAASDVRDATELTVLASDLGGLPMVTAPFVSEITDAQIMSFFRQMAKLSRTGLLIYNAPGIGITLTPDILEALSDVEGVIGVKQGDLTPAVVDRLANRLGDKVRLFCASDLAFHGPMMAGFDGLSSTNSCALSGLILESFRALARGDAVRSRDLHKLWYPFRALARQHGQPQTVKAAMIRLGLGGGSVRPPLRDLDFGATVEVGAVLEVLARDARSDIALPEPEARGPGSG